MHWSELNKEDFLPSLVKRLEAHVHASGETEAQFARRIGSSEALFKNLRKGSFPTVERLHAILYALGETLTIGASIPPVAADGMLVNIPLHAAELAAGSGFVNGSENVVDYLAFKTDWLRRMGIAPQNAVLARVKGASMAPTISDRDLVLIDTARREIRPRPRNYKSTRPPVFALMVGEEARIKRVSYVDTNLVALLSDNQEFSPEFKGTHDPDELRIIGRVCWWGHSEEVS